MFTPPDRPLSGLDKWVVIYESYDPLRDPRFAQSRPEGFDKEVDAKAAAQTAKARLQKGKRRILYAVAYPPVTKKNQTPYVVNFQRSAPSA
jgi:hypothetical protein